MAKHPKNHEDDDEEFNSTKHHENRKAKIKAEHDEQEAAAQAEADVNVENQEIANFHGLPQEGETREQLLARIRKLRENPPPGPEPEIFRSAGLQKEFDAEQEAGRASVARYEELKQQMEAARAKAEGEKKAE